MIKQEVTYRNHMLEKDVTKELYFHVNLPEAMEMVLYDNLQKTLNQVTSPLDETDEDARLARNQLTYEFVTYVIEKAYGERSEDGEEFIKSKKRTEKFMGSEAYSALLGYLLFGDNPEERFATFLNNLFPEALMKKAEILAEAESKKTKK